MIRIGPVGWTHPALGEIWPEPKGALQLLAQHFGCIEADAAQWALPTSGHVARWRAVFAAASRSGLCLRLPPGLFDLEGDPAKAEETLRRAAAAYAPLFRRPELVAFVAKVEPSALFAPGHARSLLRAARVMAPSKAPLVLEAEHHSWWTPPAQTAIRGAGWTLASVDRTLIDGGGHPRPAPGNFAMVRVPVMELPTKLQIERLAQSIRGQCAPSSVVLFEGVSQRREGSGIEPPVAGIVGALMLKRALVPEERAVFAWKEIVQRAPKCLDRLELPEGPDRG